MLKHKVSFVCNEKGCLEVYIGNKGKWYKVSNELRVNERSFNEMLREESKEIESYIKDKVEKLIGWYENFKDGNRN